MKIRIALPLLAAVLVAALLSATAAFAAAPAKPAAKVVLQAKLTRCPAPGLAAKPVGFAASMPALPGSGAGARMAMKFELQQRGGGRG